MQHDVFLSGDTHWGHENMLVGESDFGTREFSSIQEHDERLIEAWNEAVSPGDRVYHLGDIWMWRNNPEKCERIMSRLNGQVYLIEGNHDRADDWPDSLIDHFVYVKKRAELRVDGYRSDGSHLYIALSHYPMRTWDRRFYGALHAYGHVHAKLDGGEEYVHENPALDDSIVKVANKNVSVPGAMDVGIDNAKRLFGTYRPIHLDEFIEEVQAEKYWAFLSEIKSQDNAEMILSTPRLAEEKMR